jgi:hypothetical protein
VFVFMGLDYKTREHDTKISANLECLHVAVFWQYTKELSLRCSPPLKGVHLLPRIYACGKLS